MIDGKNVLCLVTARGGSKGLHKKNIKSLMGRPLVQWPILAGLKSKYIDRVVLSTDDQDIANIGFSAGAAIPFLRPNELAADEAKSIDVIYHALDYVEKNELEKYQIIVLLEPTSPFTTSQDVDTALEKMIILNAKAIVGVGLSETHHPIFSYQINESGFLVSYLNKDNVIRRQDLDKAYYLDGSLYVSYIDVLRELGTFYHQATVPQVFPKWKNIEIDDEVDFLCAEAIAKRFYDELF